MFSADTMVDPSDRDSTRRSVAQPQIKKATIVSKKIRYFTFPPILPKYCIGDKYKKRYLKCQEKNISSKFHIRTAHPVGDGP
jgi:hypothetical protein